jgi:hypothetical protein
MRGLHGVKCHGKPAFPHPTPAESIWIHNVSRELSMLGSVTTSGKVVDSLAAASVATMLVT